MVHREIYREREGKRERERERGGKDDTGQWYREREAERKSEMERMTLVSGTQRDI